MTMSRKARLMSPKPTEEFDKRYGESAVATVALSNFRALCTCASAFLAPTDPLNSSNECEKN